MCKKCCENCVYYDTECYKPICTHEDVGGSDYITDDPAEYYCAEFEKDEQQ